MGWVTRYPDFKFGCIPGALIGVAYGMHLGLSEDATIAPAALDAAVTGLAAVRLFCGCDPRRRG